MPGSTPPGKVYNMARENMTASLDLFKCTRFNSIHQWNLLFMFATILFADTLFISGLFIEGTYVNFTGEPSSFIAHVENPYVIENKDVCKNVTNLSCIVIVNTATFHFSRRANMRDTWTNSKILKHHVIKTVFLLGRTSNRLVQTMIDNEQETFGDIVQGNFIDTYQNLSHKAVLGLRWVSENCHHAKLVVKVDDDVFLDTFELLTRFENEYKYKTRHIWCPLRIPTNSVIYRGGRWKVAPNIFPNMTSYPFPNCMGFVVVATNDTTRDLYQAAKVTSFFWIDDIFVYGMLVQTTGRITMDRLTPVSIEEKDSFKCLRKSNGTQKCRLLVGRAVTETLMDKLWAKTLAIPNKFTKEELRDSGFP